MAQLNLSLPSFQGLDLSDEKQLRKLTSYLYRLDEQLRYVLNNLGEENLSDSLRAIINAQTDAMVLDEMTGQVQRLSTQIVQTAQAISLKADKKTLDALGETLGQSIAELEVTAEEIRAEVSDTASGLQSQINQTAEAIEMKASKEEVQTIQHAAEGAVQTATGAQATANAAAGAAANAQNAASEAAQAAQNAQSTANSAQTSADALVQRVTKAESEIAVQADEIALRVTKTQYETGLDGKLDADKPSVGVQTASAVVNEKGVYLTGGEIDMRTSSGEDYVNITERGVEASSLRAPDVTPRYAGSSRIYVDPEATSEEIATGWTYRSLQEALEALSGRVVGTVTVYVMPGALYETARLTGAMITGWLNIRAYNSSDRPVLTGGLALAGCSGRIMITGMDIQATGYYGLDISGCGPSVTADSCKVTGGQYGCVIAGDGSNVSLIGCEMYDAACSVLAASGSRVYMENNKGNCRVVCQKSIVQACGTVPSGSASYFDYSESWAGKVFTENVTVDQGSGGSTSTVPTIGSIGVYAEETASYNASGGVWSDDNVTQGWWEGGGRIRGVMWFYNDLIRSELSGKSVLSAALRLTMKTSGRGTQVTVELAGTSANVGGNPAVTKTYGAIATMSPKETATITLPVQAVNDLVSGAINGLMLYSSDTGPHKEREYSKNYAAFTGASGDSSTRPMLTITYEG